MFAKILPGEEAMRIGSDTITLQLSRHEAKDLPQHIETLKGGRMQLPPQLFGDGYQIVDSKVICCSSRQKKRQNKVTLNAVLH